jgi:hypothetical protein
LSGVSGSSTRNSRFREDDDQRDGEADEQRPILPGYQIPSWVGSAGGINSHFAAPTDAIE